MHPIDRHKGQREDNHSNCCACLILARSSGSTVCSTNLLNVQNAVRSLITTGEEVDTHACWAAVRRVPVPLLAEAAVSRAMASEMLVPAGRFRFTPMF